MSIVRSIALSLVASAAGTYLLRQLLSAQSLTGGDGKPTRPYASNVVVVVPILVGNSGNHIFRIEGRRGLFRR
jgi:hypothetical protein